MTEAKGSDVRAACKAAATDIYNTHSRQEWMRTLSLTALVPNSPAWADIIEHYLAPVVEARVQAAVQAERRPMNQVGGQCSHPYACRSGSPSAGLICIACTEVQAAAVEMRERCANEADRQDRMASVISGHCNCNRIVAERIRTLPIPTNALDAALGAGIDKFKENLFKHLCAACRDDSPAIYQHGQWVHGRDKDLYGNTLPEFLCEANERRGEIIELERQLAALTQPAPERKEK